MLAYRPDLSECETYPGSNWPVKAYPIRLNLSQEQRKFNRSSSSGKAVVG